jgi:Flp pilus assembly protein TadD
MHFVLVVEDKKLLSNATFLPLYGMIGRSDRELRKDDEALKDLGRAVGLLPSAEELLCNRADLLKKMGILRGQNIAIDSAVRGFNRVPEVNPNHAKVWNGLAICMKELGKDKTARQYFDRSHDLIKTGKDRYKKRNHDSQV